MLERGLFMLQATIAPAVPTWRLSFNARKARTARKAVLTRPSVHAARFRTRLVSSLRISATTAPVDITVQIQVIFCGNVFIGHPILSSCESEYNDVIGFTSDVCVLCTFTSSVGMTTPVELCWGGYYCPDGMYEPNPSQYICPRGMHCPNGSEIYQVSL